MKKCLIMLTSEYPFGKMESFIESEISSHPANFDKTVILAIDLQKNAVQTRELPPEVDRFNVARVNRKIGRLSDVALGSLGLFKSDEYYKSDKSAIGNSFPKKVFHKYFCQRAKREFGYCVDALGGYDFSEFDEVVIYSYWMFVSALIGIKLKEKISESNPDVHLVTRCHGYDVYEEINILKYLPMREYIFKNCDRIFPCSEYAEDYLKEKYPLYSNKISRSHLGTPDFGEKTFKKDAGKLNIISCSNMVELKRINKIIEALSLLDNSAYNITWTHVGDGVLRDKLVSLADEKLKNIRFSFTGQLSNKAVYDLYLKNNFDLFINTSSTEGLPVSIMEAISFGTPVIATDVGGVSEIVKNDCNGKLIDKDFSIAELADLIKLFAEADTEQISVFRKNARLIWSENFDAKVNYSNFSKIISEL